MKTIIILYYLIIFEFLFLLCRIVKRDRGRCKFFNSDCSSDYILKINKELITVSVISESFLDISINYYLSCIKKFNINNYLFVSTDNKSYKAFRDMKINILLFKIREVKEYGNLDYRSRNYGIIVRLKVPIVYSLLRIGLRVLLIDPDIHFFKNPITFFNSYVGFDLVISQECDKKKEMNSGE